VGPHEPEQLVAVAGELRPVGRAKGPLKGALAGPFIRKRQSKDARQRLPGGVIRGNVLQTQAFAFAI
jgi:hypothetical protein